MKVRLVSGGPVMVVESVEANNVKCVWLADNKKFEETFTDVVLNKHLVSEVKQTTYKPAQNGRLY
jgi:uncharacterized protein YodC (DUF2158 family)